MNKTISSITVIIVIIVVIVGIAMVRQSVVSPSQPSSPVSVPVVKPNVGNPLPKTDIIRLTDPTTNQSVSSPLNLKGEARGSWYFEGSFPVLLTDLSGKVIAKGTAKAGGQWMTDDFVPFSASLTFSLPASVKDRRAIIVLKKDNPSGIASKDASIQIPVVIK